MSGRKQKKHDYADLLKYIHDYADLLKYMRLLESGRSIHSICTEYGINNNQLRVLWAKYQRDGVSGLRKSKIIKADFAIKRQIVLDIEENHLPLHAASLKYGASSSRISVWLRLYRENGLAALEIVKKRGRSPGMGRPRKNSKPLTEENQELKTEIALLKKVRALVEERKARQRGIGQEPSRN